MDLLGRMAFHDFGVEGFSFGPNLEMKFNKLNLFAGHNGAGKSLMFKSAWFMSFSLNLYKAILIMNLPNKDEALQVNMEALFDMTFDSPERVSGTIEVSDIDNEVYAFRVTMDGGKLINFSLDIKDASKFNAGEISQISYNTKEARTFTQFERYLKLQKKFGLDMMQDLSQFKELSEYYRMYDIMWFEKLKMDYAQYNAKNPDYMSKFELWSKTFKREDYGKDFPNAEDFRFDGYDLYVDNDVVTMKRMSDYDLGTQSLVMLTLFGS